MKLEDIRRHGEYNIQEGQAVSYEDLYEMIFEGEANAPDMTLQLCGATLYVAADINNEGYVIYSIDATGESVHVYGWCTIYKDSRTDANEDMAELMKSIAEELATGQIWTLL